MSKMNKPHGHHDFDYQLVLNVTNNAMLSSIFTFKITVDTTAPLPGVVSDSVQSEPDVDFQKGLHSARLVERDFLTERAASCSTSSPSLTTVSRLVTSRFRRLKSR
ncbi:hypothetical protein NP493_5317g00004 [Ridgeia piscesae]|uniref:Uncharacterized protein n=1 Tax=Ridgeia piscesae TaxID=27915 RepID=A0AAD9IUJ9_RIDPI|nr:hypothetical protein NP493_5317g00004 [Ridgeia piscesae]